MYFTNNKDLINHIISEYYIRYKKPINSKIIEALLSIDRKNYCFDKILSDNPSKILSGQTISAPHIHLFALNELVDNIIVKKKNVKILDIGFGSGYITACFAKIFDIINNKNTKIIGVDIHKDLLNYAINNIKKQDIEILSEKYGGKNIYNNLTLYIKNGLENLVTYSNYKYDIIHVGASSDSRKAIEILKKKLKIGGKLLLPYKNSYLLITKINKSEYISENLLSVRFVPLIFPKKTRKSKS